MLNQYETERYIKGVCDRANIRLVWHDKKTAYCTQDKKGQSVIYLPAINASMSQDVLDDFMSSTVHEASHVLHTNFTAVPPGVNANDSFLGAITNAIEDCHIDYINGQNYLGDNQLRRRVTRRLVDNLLTTLKKPGLGIPEQRIAALLGWDAKCRSAYWPEFSGLEEDFATTITDPTVKAQYEKLLSGDYADVSNSIRRVDDKHRTGKAYALARRIFEEVFQEDADKEEQRCEQEAKAKGGEGEGEGDGEGDGEKEGEGDKKGKSKAKGAGEDEQDGEGGHTHSRVYSELQQDTFNISRNTSHKGHHVEYKSSGRGGANYTPTPLKDVVVVDYKNGKSNSRHVSANIEPDRYERYQDTVHGSDGFAQKVRRLLQIRSRGRTQYGTKSGALHNANLYRVTMTDAKGYNERVFKKRIVTDTLDSAVCVLCDTSGSMSGDKYANTMRAAIHLSSTLGNVLHIPIEILGFTELDCRNTVFVHRDFDTTLLSDEKLRDRMASAANHMCNNADGESVYYAYWRLSQRKEKRKVLIVLSDGSPAGDKSGDLVGYTAKVIKNIEDERKVDIIGIGIRDNNVARFYKQHQIIKDASEIEPALLKLIERKLV